MGWDSIGEWVNLVFGLERYSGRISTGALDTFIRCYISWNNIGRTEPDIAATRLDERTGGSSIPSASP